MAAADAIGPLRVLFLCTGNSCRSQMAEAWARALHPRTLEAHSAGTEPHGLNRLAVRAMAECGVDMAHHTSKHVDTLVDVPLDAVITVCSSAHETCPRFPRKVRVIHAGFDDPPRLARDARTDDDAMPHYRRVRDEIRAFIQTLPATLQAAHAKEQP